MIRQIKPQDVTIRPDELLGQLGIEDLDLNLKDRRLRWYGLFNSAVKTVCDKKYDGNRGPWRPKVAWNDMEAADTEES